MKKILMIGLLFYTVAASAQKKSKLDPMEAQINLSKNEVITILNNSYEADKKTALQIWNYAEVGYKETKSAALHVQNLKAAGFTVETGVADIPTAFVATYGLSLIHI